MDVDWKLFGLYDQDGQTQYVFYDAASVVHRRDGYLEVWAKTIDQRSMFEAPKQKAVKDLFDKKVQEHYRPPSMSTDKPLTDPRLITVIMEEAAADSSRIEPSSRMLIEVDCDQKSTRYLSQKYYKPDRIDAIDQPDIWRRASPETTEMWLINLACRKPASTKQ